MHMTPLYGSSSSATILPLQRGSATGLSKRVWKLSSLSTTAFYLVVIISILFFVFNSYILYNVLSGGFSEVHSVDCDKGREPLVPPATAHVKEPQKRPRVVLPKPAKPFRQAMNEPYTDPNNLVRKKPSKQDPNVIQETTEFLSQSDINDKGCGHTLDRNYKLDPVKVTGKFTGEFKGCAIGCVGDNAFSGFADVYTNMPLPVDKCEHTKGYQFTMENVPVDKRRELLSGTTQLTSDVPVPYYSWAEYDYMYQPAKKTATAMLAVFISNCGAYKRLQILEELMEYNVTVHSYGKCMHNTDIPEDFTGSYLDQKTALTATYKFTFAAENSETEDYVTEKLFGTLSSGSVPVYLGAPNARKFAPAQKSVIYVSDFASTKELADYLIELDKDDKQYNEYLQWKKEGPSKDFMAVVDRAIVHSSCRLCIRVADHQRAMYGNRVGHEAKKKNLPEDTLALQVRPRGEFYLRYVYLSPNERTMESLNAKVLEMYAEHNPSPGEVHSIFRLWDRLERPLDDKDFKNGVIEEDLELEIIFTYPIHKERGMYYKWQQKNGKA